MYIVIIRVIGAIWNAAKALYSTCTCIFLNCRFNFLWYFKSKKSKTSQVVKNAIQNHFLHPGSIWAKGYHFTLKKSEGRVFLAVVGINKDNQFTKLFYDPETGDYLGEQINN